MSPRRTLGALLLIPFLAARLAAQCVLMAEDGGKMSWVRAARGSDPCVERDGKIRPILTQGYALVGVPDYLPVFVSVRDIAVRTSHVNTQRAEDIGHTFHFDATFVTGFRLRDVFIVLYFVTGNGDQKIFLSEVGDLEPNDERTVSAIVPLDSKLGTSKYHLHVFSGGQEVLQSMIPLGEREAVLDRIVAKRIKDVRDSAPSLLIGPTPEYPRSLKAANLKGLAKIAIHIGANGAVTDPVVRSASDPAFGEAALAAIRMWRFLPSVRNGTPVATNAVIPFVFDPPSPH
jgi:TonB family protein